MKFIKNVFLELKQSTWLSKKQLIKTTFAVVLSTVGLAGFIYLIDLLTSGVYGFMIKSL